MAKPRYITRQSYRDPVIVAAKRRAKDYEVFWVEVEIDGEPYRVVVDGHHSHAAAKADGVAPEYTEMGGETASELEYLGAEAYLDAHCAGDTDWHDINTGKLIW